MSRDKAVRGVNLTGTPEDSRQALVSNDPIFVAPVGDQEMIEYAQIVDEFSIHDAMIVASHRAQVTDAILTSDNVIGEAGYHTLWE